MTPASASTPAAESGQTPAVAPPAAAPAVTVAEPPAVYPADPAPVAPATPSTPEGPQAATPPAPPVAVEPPATPPTTTPATPEPPAAEEGAAAAGVRALQEAFAIDVAEREDRHRAEVRAMQQSFLTDTTAREDRHRAEVQALHQRMSTESAATQERHRTEVQGLRQQIEELRTQVAEAKAAGQRESESRANAEAEGERLRVELETDRSEISRLNSRNAELSNSLATARQEVEQWTAQAKRLDGELQTAIANAEQAAAEAKRKIDETTRKLEETTRSLDDTTRRLEATEERATRFSELAAAHDAAGQQLRQTITEQRAERERMTEERDAARQQAAELEAQLRSAELDAEQAADDAARKLQDMVRQFEDAEEHAARVAGQISVHEATIDELRRAMAEQQAELKKVSYDRDAARRRISQLEDALDASQHEVSTPRAEAVEEVVDTPTPMRRKTDLSPQVIAAKAATIEQPLSISEDIDLVQWQREALAAWATAGHRGVVEAVTGAGKTRLAHWAIAEALDADMKVLVIAPTTERVDHWYESLRAALPINRVGKRTGARDEQLGSFHVVVSTAADAARERISGSTFEGLIVADQVHVYGDRDLSLALDPRYAWRLGLTAAYERDDDGIATYVDPYFDGVVYRLGYERALADEAIAPFDIALVSVALTNAERAEYDRVGHEVEELASALRTNFGVRAADGDAFDEAVAALAADRGPARPMARNYQKAAARRDEIVDKAAGKSTVMKVVAKRVQNERALVFAQSHDAAAHLSKLLLAEGCTALTLGARPERGLLGRRVDESREHEDVTVLAGPRTMTTASDSATADLAVIVGASHTKLQLIQRLGRVIRAKDDDRHARVVILFVESTHEDDFADDSAFVQTVAPYAARLEGFSAAEVGALTSFLAPGSPAQ